MKWLCTVSVRSYLFNVPNLSLKGLGGDAHGCGCLVQPYIRVIPKPGEEGGDAVSVGEDLNVGGSELSIVHSIQPFA
jgi:hypothetical protein